MSKIHAIQVHGYGDANQLRLQEISQPEPQAGEVLVQVHAAGVNALDWKIRSGFMKSVMPSTFPYVPGIHVPPERSLESTRTEPEWSWKRSHYSPCRVVSLPGMLFDKGLF